jgi:acetyl esterase/lipase
MPNVFGPCVSVSSVSGPSVSGPSVSGPSVSGPSVSGPNVSGPRLVAAVQPVIETRPGNSPAARLLAPTLRNATWLLRRGSGRSSWLPAIASLSDAYLGLLQPALPGTVTSKVGFGGFVGELVTAPGASSDGSVILYFHGGAFFCCGLHSHRRLVSRISAASAVGVLNVGYRQLPAATLSQSIADCVHAYRVMLLRGYSADRVVLAGDSAGGYLAFAVALRAVEEGLPAPAGIAALAPWLDLDGTYSLDHPNGMSDPYLPMRRMVRIAPLLYGGAAPLPSLLDEADLSGLPPTLIQVGSVEALLSDAEQMTDRLARSGVGVRLQIWERQVHVFQAFADLVPEARAAIGEIGTFVTDVLADPTHQAVA